MPKKSKGSGTSKRWLKRSDASDWVRLPGKSRRYEYIGDVKSHKGATISRRDFDTLVRGMEAPEVKAQHNLEALMDKLSPSNKDIIHRFINYKVSQGDDSFISSNKKRLLVAKATRSREYKQLLRDLRSHDNSADGVKAQALVKLGLRQPDWVVAVGESPD